MNEWKYRSRILGRLIASPLVGLPIGLGFATWLFGALWGDDLLILVGACGLLFGSAVAQRRWKRNHSQIRRAAAEKYRDESNRNHEQFLNELDRRLRADDDERTNQHVEALRQLHRRMRQVGIFEDELTPLVLSDVKEKTEQLYRSCLSSLERSIVLRDTALEMMTASARGRLLTSRESLLAEVGTTIRHLGATLDFLQTSRLEKDDDRHLSRMWQELEVGLEVARRVEDRMTDLEHSLRDDVLDQPGRI